MTGEYDHKQQIERSASLSIAERLAAARRRLQGVRDPELKDRRPVPEDPFSWPAGDAAGWLFHLLLNSALVPHPLPR